MRACRATLVAGVALGLVSLVTAPSAAQLVQGEGWSLSLAGYARALGGASDLGYDPGFADRRAAFTGQVVRLKWLFELDGRIRVSVHNKGQALATSSTSGQGVLGFGVSVVPNRAVDLETTILDGDHGRAWHDVDRVSATAYLSVADVTVGRQAITWGISSLFPVADLWAQFSPFELDTEEKPGTDAVRVLSYPVNGVELDLVAADRGTGRNFSVGGRATIQTPVGDIYVGAGKFWREVIALGGVSFVVGAYKLRAEAAVPRELDDDEWLTPRLTAGVDWLGPDIFVTVEYHLNGLGSSESGDYVSLVSQPAFARGETYYLGRHYLGASASYLATDRWTLSLAGLANLNDPSTALLPAVTYDMGQAIRINVGGLVGVGATPAFQPGPVPELESEFGTYGSFGYLQLSVYF